MSERTERGVGPVGRWSPFPELEALADWDPFGRGRTRPGFSPAVDVVENDDEYVISAELAGAKKGDVTLELHEQVLTVRGEKRSEREERKDEARHVERFYGTFSRSFTLPSNADADRLEAGFEDGVLTVRIPKSEESKPRVIDIQTH